jgi:hypothetical protein
MQVVTTKSSVKKLLVWGTAYAWYVSWFSSFLRKNVDHSFLNVTYYFNVGVWDSHGRNSITVLWDTRSDFTKRREILLHNEKSIILHYFDVRYVLHSYFHTSCCLWLVLWTYVSKQHISNLTHHALYINMTKLQAAPTEGIVSVIMDHYIGRAPLRNIRMSSCRRQLRKPWFLKLWVAKGGSPSSQTLFMKFWQPFIIPERVNIRDFSLVINSDGIRFNWWGTAYIYVRFYGVYIRRFWELLTYVKISYPKQNNTGHNRSLPTLYKDKGYSMNNWQGTTKKKKTKLHGLSPRANYTDRATAASLWSGCQLLRIKGATWSAWRIPTAVFSVF